MKSDLFFPITVSPVPLITQITWEVQVLPLETLFPNCSEQGQRGMSRKPGPSFSLGTNNLYTLMVWQRNHVDVQTYTHSSNEDHIHSKWRMPEVTQCRVKTFTVVCACVISNYEVNQPSGQWRPHRVRTLTYPTVMRYPPLKYPQ